MWVVHEREHYDTCRCVELEILKGQDLVRGNLGGFFWMLASLEVMERWWLLVGFEKGTVLQRGEVAEHGWQGDQLTEQSVSPPHMCPCYAKAVGNSTYETCLRVLYCMFVCLPYPTGSQLSLQPSPLQEAA